MFWGGAQPVVRDTAVVVVRGRCDSPSLLCGHSPCSIDRDRVVRIVPLEVLKLGVGDQLAIALDTRPEHDGILRLRVPAES